MVATETVAAASFCVQSVHAMSQRGHTPTHISGNSQQPWKCHELRAEATPCSERVAPSITREGKEVEAGRKK